MEEKFILLDRFDQAEIDRLTAEGYEVGVRSPDEIAPDVPDTPGGPYPAAPVTGTATVTVQPPLQTWGFNPNQLATHDEAKALAAELGSVGGGVREIYLGFWLPQGGPQPQGEVDGTLTLPWLFRFNNGIDGVNVGLVRETKKRYPTRWLAEVARDVEIG